MIEAVDNRQADDNLSAKPPLLVLLGPTAVGKTKLSLDISRRYGCEIISGDSMQVYRGMDIGTAKIPPGEREGIPHHLIDIRDPDEPFSAADFQELARPLIEEILRRGNLPFIVGGTGLYIESLCYGFQFSEGGADPEFRREQEQYLEREGAEALHKRLQQTDPASAKRLHPNDTRRVIRALEIFHITGTSMSEQLAKQTRESPYDLCLIGLTMDRRLLYNRIEERIDEMIRLGLADEVARLLADGYSAESVAMQGLGYKEIAACLEGRSEWDESVRLLKQSTRRFAKRQLSWFRHMDEIHWVDVTDQGNFSKHLQVINDIITGKFTYLDEYSSEQS